MVSTQSFCKLCDISSWDFIGFGEDFSIYKDAFVIIYVYEKHCIPKQEVINFIFRAAKKEYPEAKIVIIPGPHFAFRLV